MKCSKPPNNKEEHQMVDVTEALEGQYLNADLVKASPTKKMVIIREGEYQDSKYGRKLVLSISIDGKIKEWRPNKDSVKNLSNKFGTDTKLWLNKVARVDVVSIQGKDSVLATAEA